MPLRKSLLEGEPFLASSLAVTLAKMHVKGRKRLQKPNKMSVDSLLILVSLMKTLGIGGVRYLLTQIWV